MKILISEPLDFHVNTLSFLKKKAEVITGPFTREELLVSVKDIDVLIIRLNHRIDKELLRNAKNLKYILSPTTGLDHIDIEEAELKNISIVSLQGETDFLQGIPSTAEHTWALLMSLVRKIPQSSDHVKSGYWNRECFKAHNLASFKLGILGYGRVGQQVGKIAEAFNMPYVFFDTDISKQNMDPAVSVLEDFLGQIDILSIHIPSNTATKNFLNSERLSFLKTGCYIINTSRGEVIDEAFATSLLKQKKLSGIATDVLAMEQDEKARNENSLIKALRDGENVIITPHISGATYESMWLTEEFVVKKWMKIKDQFG